MITLSDKKQTQHLVPCYLSFKCVLARPGASTTKKDLG